MRASRAYLRACVRLYVCVCVPLCSRTIDVTLCSMFLSLSLPLSLYVCVCVYVGCVLANSINHGSLHPSQTNNLEASSFSAGLWLGFV